MFRILEIRGFTAESKIYVCYSDEEIGFYNLTITSPTVQNSNQNFHSSPNYNNLVVMLKKTKSM